MQSDTFLQKKSLREQLNTQLDTCSQENLEQWGQSIQKRVLASDLFLNAKSIALYQAFIHEVGTELLFEQSRNSGKKIAFPKVEQEGSALTFFWVNALDQLQKSKWGILEPDESLGAQRASLNEIDLMLLPALAFDSLGYRLGRGKGFYDRTLKGFLGQRLGLAYSFQILQHLPQDAWDERVSWIATENEWLCIGKSL